MALSGISLLDGVTSNSFTGGTALVFEKDGTPVATGVHVSDTTETDLRLKKHITFKNVNTKLQSDGSFSKSRRSMVLTIPFELADGSISYQVFRGEIEFHPEFAAVAGNLDNLRYFGAQVLTDSETDTYFDHGSVD
jgi:hypothetical protein